MTQYRYNSIYRGPIIGNTLYAMDTVFTNGATSVGGSGHPAIYDENNVVAKAAYNRAIIMGSKIYWLQGNSIFSSNFSSNTVGDPWKLEKALPSGINAGKRSLNTGLYAVMISGIAGLATVHSPNSNTIRASRYLSNTDTWIDSEELTLSNISIIEGSGGFRGEIGFNNKIYAACAPGYVIYDAHKNIFTQGSWPNTASVGGAVRGPHDFCPFNGKLYAHGHNAANGAWNLYEMVDGSGPTYKATAGAVLTADYNLEGRSCLFTDREKLYSLVYTPAAPHGGWTFYEWAPSGVDGIQCNNDVTTDFGPPDARGGPVDANITDRLRATVFCCQEDFPEGDETQQFYFDRAGGTGIGVPSTGNGLPSLYPAYKEYILNGLGPLFANSAVDQAGRLNDSFSPSKIYANSYQMAYPNTKNGGGDRTEILSGRPRIEIRSIVPSGNIFGITYRTITNTLAFPTGTLCTVQFRYDTLYHSPRNPCVLSNPSVGTLSSNGYIISTVAADSTDYYVEWDTTDNGLSGRVKTALVGFISTTGTF